MENKVEKLIQNHAHTEDAPASPEMDGEDFFSLDMSSKIDAVADNLNSKKLVEHFIEKGSESLSKIIQKHTGVKLYRDVPSGSQSNKMDCPTLYRRWIASFL